MLPTVVEEDGPSMLGYECVMTLNGSLSGRPAGKGK
jgi:hypothetical protein